MDIHTLYVFVDTPNKYCFSRVDSTLKLPKPIIQWAQITPKAFELIKGELPQPQSLIHEITKGIKQLGYFIVDFGDSRVLLNYLYLDWEEKWDKYIALQEKAKNETRNALLRKEYKEAGKVAIIALQKWVTLIEKQIKSGKSNK